MGEVLVAKAAFVESRDGDSYCVNSGRGGDIGGGSGSDGGGGELAFSN